MPLLDHTGTPIGTALDFDAPIRAAKALSQRSAEIIRSITLWEMSRGLSPMLVCRRCFEQYPDWSSRNKHTVEIASNEAGALLALCSCSSWVCPSPVPLDTSDIPRSADIVTLVTIGKTQRPIGNKEARLLVAWRQVMLDHHWFEILWCINCQKRDPLSACHPCFVIPDKSIAIDCACTERRWTGITK